MTRRQRPEPGFAPWPRHTAVRVNDLVELDLPAALAIVRGLGLPVAYRSQPAGPDVRAVLTATAAGTVVTLETLTGRRRGRRRALRELGRLLTQIMATASASTARDSP